MAKYPFHIPFMTMQIEIMTWSSIISCTVRCIRMRIGMIHDVMRAEMRSGTNSVKCIQWNAHWIWNRYRMGLLNSENEDVTNVTSESSNPYTSLKFQRTRWKRSSSWTWPMSLPFTSSDTTCNQHFSLLPLPRRSMLIQCILQHHQICNLEAEPVKMNELFDGREDHPLIPSQPRYLTRILYFKPK